MRIRNGIVWMLGGQIVPLIAALLGIPYLLGSIGQERFGYISLVWVCIGYFSLLDGGLAKSIVKRISEKPGADADIGETFWTGLAILVLVGGLFAIAICLSATYIIDHVLTISPALREEATGGLLLLGATLPIITSTSCLRGVLEAHGRFDLVAVVKMPVASATFVGPIIVTAWTQQLDMLVLSLVVARVANLCINGYLCGRLFNIAFRKPTVEETKRLLTFGGWITVSNTVGPIISYLDRFLIAAFLPVATIAFYTVPYEVVTKLWLLPDAIGRVLFPHVSRMSSRDNRDTAALFDKTVAVVFTIMVPPCLIIAVFSEQLLTLWLNKDFAEESHLVVRIMAIGVLLNSIARIPSVWMQAIGRPDLRAKIHMVELPISAVLFYVLINNWGILGAAIGFTTRIALDFLLFMPVLAWVDSSLSSALMKTAGLALIGVGFLFAGLFALLAPASSIWLLMVTLMIIFSLFCWASVIGEEAKQKVRRKLMKMPS